MQTAKYLAGAMAAVIALYSTTSRAQTDHGDMSMQGGSAPADARDPHAWSDGYTLTAGPYAQAGIKPLTLLDERKFWSVLANRLEYNDAIDATVFNVQGWYGTTYDRAVVKGEGEVAQGRLQESELQLLWNHAISAYFDTQLGLRFDQYDTGQDRQWLAAGIQGMAPYWFELDITAYLGDRGRSALSMEAEYELLLTQRLILQSRAELNLYGRDDVSNGLGSGLSDLSLGLRLRYEFSRQFAPYIGIEWTDSFGDTADYRQAAGRDISDTQLVAGLRFWF
ncbi:MAG TPA: copper resistance protein B [Spongiibacteraceae bacterium]|nr:copper resistance protein B [Spongiibacteraceae bacterium]